ncbi:hypothetical protein [Parabacteroides sp.]
MRNAFLFEAMTNLDTPARMEDGKLRFDFKLVEQDPEAHGTGFVGNVGNFLGDMLGVDVLFNKPIRYEEFRMSKQRGIDEARANIVTKMREQAVLP